RRPAVVLLFPTRRSSDLLVVPILVFQNVGVGEAISRSASMFKRTWGENVAGNVGIGLVGAIAGLLGVGAIGLGTLIGGPVGVGLDRKSTRLNSSHVKISY